MLTRLGILVTRATAATPFTNVIGTGRTLLGLATFLTLLFNGPGTLFVGLHGGAVEPQCTSVAALGAFCLGLPLELVRWSAIAVLIAVITGYRPRWTCVPHWYVAFSVQANGTVVDGGDQLAAIVTLLLIPLCLADKRRSHWSNEDGVHDLTRTNHHRRLTAQVSLLLIQLQVLVLYFDAGVAKLGVREWADGTAMYYWLSDPTFGADTWQQWFLRPILTNGITVTLFTWLMLFGEIVLAFGVLIPWRHRKPFLIASVLFHVGIAVAMGLVTFALTMIAADVLAYHDARVPIRPLRIRTKSLGTASEKSVTHESNHQEEQWVTALPTERGSSPHC